ncbi:MAG: hypothetical protein KDJ43_10335 [Rhizobiaceae bacterium]|nr:hypothetical protein [Rhizobiaceae bacterium]
MTSNDRRGSSTAERWFDHAVRVMTVAAILSGATWLLDMRTSVAVIHSEIGQLRNQLGKLEGLSSDRYTGTEARRDLARVQDMISDHEARLRSLEMKKP